MGDARQKWIVKAVSHAFDIPNSTVEECIRDQSTQALLTGFFGGEPTGATRIIFYRQKRDRVGNGGEAYENGGPEELFVTSGDTDRLKSRAIFFVRVCEKAVSASTVDTDLNCGIIEGLPVANMRSLVTEVYTPVLTAGFAAWDKKMSAEAKDDMYGVLDRFSSLLGDVIDSLANGLELKKPSAGITITDGEVAKAAADQRYIAAYEEIVEDWCNQVDRLLAETDDNRNEPDDAGPSTELEYWRSRMGKFNSITEQLKQPACKLPLAVLGLAKARVMKRWRTLDNAITDATNEAKDNVKYLSTLEKYIEPLYTGDPHTIIDALPGLLNNTRMMLTIARYYSTRERMSLLFRKVTNQMIANCREHVMAGGILWSQPTHELIARLDACLTLHENYLEQYHATRAKLEETPSGKQFDFDVPKIFGKFELFQRRIDKLIEMFRIFDQFSALARHNVEGMDGFISNFFGIMEEFKRKPYDLLDFTNNQFDRDYLEFSANIHELESSLQGFINQSFESISSTENALMLLKQFQLIMQRPSLREDLDSKLTLIFHNYTIDLETVQRLYEKQKSSTPAVRNMPPVSANVAWARQLMRRIEVPMHKFQANSALMQAREAKKITKTYNKIARTIIEFETLWKLAWAKGIDSARAGLHATLLVRHPNNNKLYANFDPEILQLLRETKCLMRMGEDVPEAARMVLLQEDKLKSYYNKLSYALGEYEALNARLHPLTHPLLKPHLADMDAVLQPGMVTLTWTSMNIDGYVHSIHAALFKLNDLVNKIHDLVHNRIDRNVHLISDLDLVDLKADESFTLDRFVSAQEKHMKELTVVMRSKSMEVEAAVTDLIHLIQAFPREHVQAEVPDDEVRKVRAHFAGKLYEAVLHATSHSLNKVKDRVGSRTSGGFLYLERPFFDVQVELDIPEVVMNPPLDDIQLAIYKCSKAILACSKSVPIWASEVMSGEPMYEMVSKDRDIVRSLLLLRGSIEGAKRQVHDYLQAFTKYDWLWKGNMQQAYEAFMAKDPSLEDFELELKRYVDVEAEITKIAPVHNIGALSLETGPLKSSLMSEANAWKAQYAQNLHRQARTELDRISQWLHDMNRNLKREVNDLDDVRSAVTYLEQLRDKEANLDAEYGPVEDMYALLARYDVPVPKEETDIVTDLRYSWKKLKKLAGDLQEHLSQMQAPFKKNLVRNIKLFVVDVIQFRNDFEANGPMVPGVAPMEADERLRKFQRLFEERERKWTAYSEGQKLFGLPVTEYPELVKTKQELQLLEKLYGLYTEVINTVSDFKEVLWADVKDELDMMTTKISEFQNGCKKMPKALREWDAFIEMKKTIDDFLESLPMVQDLTHQGMRDRHWTALEKVCGQELPVHSETFKLSGLLDANLLEFREDVEEIANSAVKELQIEEKLAGIASDWSDKTLQFSAFKTRGNIILNGGATAELMELLEEAQMVLGSLMASRYVAPFKEDVQEWITKLSTVSEILESWVQVQSMWMYLEAVFTSGDIAKQLPGESKRFQGIDKNWVKIMSKANEQPIVVQYCYGNDVLQQLLPHLLEQLEMCQKALSGYLDQKRAAFPRFYFVSDPNLLEILSQGSNPEAIQPHLQSVFDSIEYVEFHKQERTQIQTIFSGVGESIVLRSRVKAEGNIEDWLNALLREMQNSLRAIVREAAGDCEVLDTADLTHKYQAQVSLIAIQFKWTADCEDALFRAKAEKGIMGQTNKKNQARLNDLVAMNMLKDDDLRKFGKWTRRKIETMITVDVHQRDVWEEIVKRKVRDTEDFEWQKQARFYWRYDMDYAMISVADVDFKYCNEYLGVKERLVITPLTDRCYITLAQALGMFLGGAPAGPAGTGKTETTKDMGCTLGKYVVVTNCSDQMDYRIMGNILKGLAQSGCWGCFDEFNRIDLEVLSVVAQQVMSVLVAIREDRKTFQFTDGQVIALDKEVGFFITMNPGYAGRQELPENLKSLFRGVTMMVPDREIIMKVKLTACGYRDATLLAKKFNVLYKLCEEQLSKQAHYDFGLRNILAVLRTAGASKRNEPEKPEQELLMRTLRDMNLSKYVAEDVPLFMSLLDDLFPGLKAEKQKHKEVEGAITQAVADLGLQYHVDRVLKVVQVYEMCLVRHSLMHVGPSGVGKTRIVETLHKALMLVKADQNLPPMVGQPHRELRMNPKAITAPQMFGALDVIANEWTEGIFAQLWRKANKDKKNFTWLMLDGPVDAIWIENLNTVMDDNRILTLANNDRIPMLRPNCTLGFEVEDLRNASPATVSRAGVIFISDNDLGYMPYVRTWLAGQQARSLAELLAPLFEQRMDALVEFVRNECRAKMVCSTIALMTSMCNLIDGLLLDLAPADKGASLDQTAAERLFMYCACWTVAGILENEDRAKVDGYFRTLFNGMPEVDAGDTIYEYTIDAAKFSWVHWSERIPDWGYSGTELSVDFPKLVIPTIDSARTLYNLERSAAMNRAVLLVGGPGTAKTSSILQVLAKQDPSTTMFKKISFSGATTPLILQRTVEGAIEKRQGKTFGPPGGKSMLVFVDDISMPQINNWGDQPTLEILRQLVEQGGLYNLQKPGEIMQIVDLLVLGCMLHPGGGKQDIPNRAKRHFHVMNVTLPSMTSIQMIFGRLVGLMYPEGDQSLNADLVSAAGRLVELTVNVWERTKAKMLPTPAKFHYIFNLRDLSRVFQGIFMCATSTVKDEHTLLALWKHEAMRVFSDRLVNADDKRWFEETVNKALDETVGASKAGKLKGDTYFVDFLQPPGEDPETGEELPAPKLYEPAPSVEKVNSTIRRYMVRFNEVHKLLAMDLVLFEDAMLHFMRISRLLATPRGNALLVGVGGSGKQSLTRLAAFIARADFAQITITKQYSANTLLEDFKPLYRTAGVLNRGVAFIFTDKEIKEESFLEYLNIFLNTGEVPNLFARDEYDAIIGEVGVPYSQIFKGSEPTKEDLWAFFIDRVRSNLHLVLCFSPVGVKFRDRAMAFPGLINNCTIDWFLPWPEAALGEVAARMVLSNKDLRCGDDIKHKLIAQMASTHRQVADSTTEYFEQFRRNAYVTPKSYLSFMDAYVDVYLKKVQHIEILASSINTGLSKLVEAGEDVAKMKIELKEKEKGLVIAQEKSAVLLQEITTSTARAEKKKAEVQGVKDQLAGDADVIAAQKEAVERDLEAAQPALDAAQNALSSINAKDIGLLKQLKNPPEIIKRIFDCVVILFKNYVVTPALVKPKENLQLEDSWSSALEMMGKPTFLNNIFNFNKDAINDETIELLHPYTSAPDFTYEDAKKASGNVAGLCTWVRAMDMYTTIAKVVKPKMEELRAAEAKLKVANAKLAKAQGELDAVQDELNKMQREFDDAMATKQRIQDDADSTQRRMDSANKLINGLEGERKRWTSMSEEFADDIRRLTGDVAVACGFVAYVGPFNSTFRTTLLNRFYEDCVGKGIPVTKDLKVSAFLVDQGTIGDWNLEGLPSDELSVQNGIMVTRSSKWPLLIDPQGQGLQWLKKREEVNGLRITSLLDKRFRNVLEDSMSFGTPMIIENVEEELDPILDPVLDKAVQRKGRNLVLVLADKECEYSETFKLSLTSKLANPHFTPELFAQVTVINFTVTMGGLEQQLLARVLGFERAELEEQRQKLVEDVNSNNKILKQLEDELLFRLANSTGNLLDDTELIDVLNTTKTTSAEVSEKLANADDTEKRINVAREEYRPVAIRGALLYFLIVEMSAVNPMYQTSLVQFLNLFDYSINNSEKKANMLASKRIGIIIEYLTFHTTCYVQRGLFERHKVVWVLMLAMKIEQIAETLSQSYVQCLLKGGGALDIKSERPKPAAWIPDKVWLNVIATSQTVLMLRDLPDSLARNDQLWRHWYDEDAPEAAKIPEYDERLSLFEKLLIVRSVREDRALLSVQTYISATIGQRYIDSRPLNLRETEEEANFRTPLVALLSRGADVTGIIMDLAKKKKVQVSSISLGQGQEPASRKLVAAGMATGSWVMLQNCHLGLKYMVEVEQQLIKLEEEHVNPAFRLWITVEPHPKFPIGLLQISIKITNEAPVGIRAGLKGSYAWLNQDVLDTVSQPQWKTMLYALCFMHTVVQERRKFGPLGFNVPYEFNQSDLSASVQFMQNHLNEVEGKKRPVDWIVVNYMVCEVQYGGKITDDWDRRLFNTYGQAWLTQRITHNEFEFYPGYRIPVGTDIELFRKYIDELPFNDNPEIFGLHVNADLAYRTLQTSTVLMTILDSQPKEGGGSGGLTREETVLKIVEDLQAKLPKDFNLEEKRACIKVLGGMNKPLNICLAQEIDRLQLVLTLVRRMLANLKLAIAGTIVMSPDLQNALDSLFLARVPGQWERVSQLIMPNIGLWWVSILSRNEQLYNWMKSNRPNCFWLTGFFNPQGFLTANRQEVCRKHVKENWALDDVISTYEVQKAEKDEVKRGPEEGIYVYGLFLDGCKWDKERGRLVDSDPKVLYALLPVIHVSACLQSAKKVDPNHNYICPLYKNPSRTGLNFISPVDLRTEEPPNKWTLRGVCLLCSKD
ncbi:hypothetical protein KFE25_007149 [Diacronema lutheri]|uniref:AAA+ ATPase domain-containing protein n=1 Tax=Diacronema lutheri TaxID=2081491 RepID=A0A8J6CAX0_DIALT|nr:hypothetical protein KFE25_007149 [Diacronema lutheri]